MIELPIEQRYDKRNQMFHSSAFAIAAGVVGVAAAGAGAAVSISSAQQAARAQAGAGKKFTKAQQQAAQRFSEAMSQVQAPQWDLARDIKEAGQITDYNTEQLEKIFPGARNQREIAAQATTSYLRGEIPKDVQDQIMRSVAELGGAGFQPTTVTPTGVPTPSGFQAPQGLLARQLGLTSLDLQQRGQQLAQSWQTIAGAFIESPLQVGQARLGYEKAAADIQMQKAAAELGVQMDVAKGAYGIAVDTIGSRLAANQAIGTGIQSVGGALAGAIGGVGSAYGQMAAAQNVTFGGQKYGAVTGFEGQKFIPQTTSSGGLYYTREKMTPSASKALTGAYG